jgi:hypothetical protein
MTRDFLINKIIPYYGYCSKTSKRIIKKIRYKKEDKFFVYGICQATFNKISIHKSRLILNIGIQSILPF